MKKIFVILLVFSCTSLSAQTTTGSGYIFFKEDRTQTAARNWAIRQNNTHEGDLQFGFVNSNTGALPNFFTTPLDAKFTISNTGFVGIGTATPGAKFHLVGGYGRVENATESSIQYKATTPNQWWDVGTNAFGYYIYEVNTMAYDFVVNKNGNVGIGTITADAKLAVKGMIHTNEVKVDLLGAVAPDYVFESSYELPSLAEVQRYIIQNNHLPEIPSAKEMDENGVLLKEMNLLLLKKIEELTLYAIDQNNILEKQEKVSVSQSELLQEQARRIQDLEQKVNSLMILLDKK